MTSLCSNYLEDVNAQWVEIMRWSHLIMIYIPVEMMVDNACRLDFIDNRRECFFFF